MLNVKLADISLLPKEYASKTIPSVKLPKGIFSLSYIILFLVIAGWGGLYFYSDQLQKEIDLVVGSIEKINNEDLAGRNEEVNKIKAANNKLNNFKGIFDKHIYSSEVFKFIEGVTLKKVQFSKFNLDVSKNSVNLSGMTGSYSDFAKQINKLRSEKDFIRDVEVSSFGIDREGIKFDLKMVLVGDVLLSAE